MQRLAVHSRKLIHFAFPGDPGASPTAIAASPFVPDRDVTSDFAPSFLAIKPSTR